MTIFLALVFSPVCLLAQSTVWREIREKLKNTRGEIEHYEEKPAKENREIEHYEESPAKENREIKQYEENPAKENGDSDNYDGIPITAEDQVDTTLESDSGIVAPDTWDNNYDSIQSDTSAYDENTPVSDEVYMDRLSKLPNIIELPYNPTVRRCIELYVERRRELVENMLGLEEVYFPMIEQTLDKYGLPLELKYLVIVESALNPTAFSRAGASGLWQFILSTGRLYGLEVNSLIDERRDPVKSTDAACRHLRDLYDMYGDWNLAIAAYNCGAGNVSKAIRRSGGQRDYWAIYPYLPRETRSYLPFFIAANYIMNYYSYHQLSPVQTSLPLSTDTVMVNRAIHFDQIADVLNIDKETIRALNPQYKKDIIPGNFKPQILKLPTSEAYAFVEKEDEIASYRTDELFPNRAFVESSQPVYRNEKIMHKVARGETVITIARKYGVSIRNVLRWNKLKYNMVPVGRTLVLYVDNGGYSENNSRPRRVTKPVSSDSYAELQKSSSSSGGSSSIEAERYKVKAGDTFYTISRKYPGFSPSDLMKLNNRSNSDLKEGQYIRVPKN